MIRDVVSYDLFTALMVLGFASVAFAKAYDAKRFMHFVSLLGNSKYLLIHTRDQKFFDYFEAFLFVNFVTTLTIFLAFCGKVFFGITDLSWLYLLKLSVSIIAFALTKVLFERLLGSLFDIDGLMNSYVFQKNTYKNFLGLLLIPVNLLFLYTLNPSKTLVIAIGCVLFAVQALGVMASFKAHQNHIKPNLFYFILYLCTLEIAPYVILFRFLREIEVF